MHPKNKYGLAFVVLLPCHLPLLILRLPRFILASLFGKGQVLRIHLANRYLPAPRSRGEATGNTGNLAVGAPCVSKQLKYYLYNTALLI